MRIPFTPSAFNLAAAARPRSGSRSTRDMYLDQVAAVHRTAFSAKSATPIATTAAVANVPTRICERRKFGSFRFGGGGIMAPPTLRLVVPYWKGRGRGRETAVDWAATDDDHVNRLGNAYLF